MKFKFAYCALFVLLFPLLAFSGVQRPKFRDTVLLNARNPQDASTITLTYKGTMLHPKDYVGFTDSNFLLCIKTGPQPFVLFLRSDLSSATIPITGNKNVHFTKRKLENNDLTLGSSFDILLQK